MIHIVITAGGTIENIDEVRAITNTSTGKLGTHLCKNVIKYLDNTIEKKSYKIHYVVTKTAVKPQITNEDSHKVVIYEVTDTESVKNCIENIFGEYTIDYFVHSMAISDFTISHISKVEELAKELSQVLCIESSDERSLKIEEILRKPTYVIESNQKISSKSDIIIIMKRTPKIISNIKKYSKNVYLVGFKLLRNVEEEDLLMAANKLSHDNGCDLVLANDLSFVTKEQHRGLLIKNKKIINRCDGKENISKAIINEMFKGRIGK